MQGLELNKEEKVGRRWGYLYSYESGNLSESKQATQATQPYSKESLIALLSTYQLCHHKALPNRSICPHHACCLARISAAFFWTDPKAALDCKSIVLSFNPEILIGGWTVGKKSLSHARQHLV